MKIKLILGKAFLVRGAMNVTVKNLLFWVRVKKGSKYWILVMHRVTGFVINEFPSNCNHNAYLNNYLRHQEYVLECCPTCEQTRGYDNNTGECFFVFKLDVDCKIDRVCHGPAGCLLLLDKKGVLLELDWDQEKWSTCLKCLLRLHSEQLRIQYIHYVECHDMLLCLVEQDHNSEVIAVRLGTRNILWNLFGQVDGNFIQPESVTSDSHGNGYVSDRGTNRILKIDSLTGDVLSILHVEEEEDEIYFIDWSITEPNLTVWRGKQIETYSIPQQFTISNSRCPSIQD